jgi:DNA repair protein RecN (Recombination protein N)
VLALLGDVGAELTAYLDRLDADPERLEQVLVRQAELKALTRKYAADVDGVIAWAEQARQRLAGLDISDEALAALGARRDELAADLVGHAAAVSAARTEAAKKLAEDTTAELAGLSMPDARLLVGVAPREAAAGARGRAHRRPAAADRRPRRRRRGGAAAGRARRCAPAAAAQGRIRR